MFLWIFQILRSVALPFANGRYSSRLCDDVAPAGVDHLLSEEETNEHQQGPEKRRQCQEIAATCRNKLFEVRNQSSEVWWKLRHPIRSQETWHMSHFSREIFSEFCISSYFCSLTRSMDVHGCPWIRWMSMDSMDGSGLCWSMQHGPGGTNRTLFLPWCAGRSFRFLGVLRPHRCQLHWSNLLEGHCALLDTWNILEYLGIMGCTKVQIAKICKDQIDIEHL